MVNRTYFRDRAGLNEPMMLSLLPAYTSSEQMNPERIAEPPRGLHTLGVPHSVAIRSPARGPGGSAIRSIHLLGRRVRRQQDNIIGSFKPARSRKYVR